ncbi:MULTISPECIES: 1-acyl-sn-glycerol-3-phosphate acyltransferase [unclassified Treponema]|uniref:1-acyl-sn-glycerol-3-phosphate acyltransferase n=1 Tax=unclassified Treponema TaxID=2638727 RepID=UPI0020A29619|nr:MULTISPECIES: 1-acyl-sn-glycerol-3-phosphate acyltransferase [unclassified Treponema]UTC67523.1 1-acyl-sn-glycerol-3-phosphate acyltransferase [Treponema sp. OMZ 789]UTC70251.1 1-acyl-sn-glycerol-3-phosphate acyltransferase [Treponema sp. OMZ 790]UTC72966.1 1-acyl-sn-glycerol-3-phosphate acyltransferase [Treponema sp. OMZ 791]
MQQTLMEYIKDYLPEIAKHTMDNQEVTPENVLQKGNPALSKILDRIVDELTLENSEFRHPEHLEEFLDEVNKGKKGIILAEHYSNLDYPAFMHLMKKTGPKGTELAEKCIAMAGLKLGEDNPYVAAFAGGYDRIYIYPSRSIQSIKDQKVLDEELKRSKAINLASMRALEKAKEEGRVVMVYPAGTRYRPGRPETKKGVKEIDSYIKMSDIMLLVSANGNCLRISDSGDMTEDTVWKDRLIFDASPVISCEEFREKVKAEHEGLTGIDKKQAVVDRVMAELEKMHEANEIGRLN